DLALKNNLGLLLNSYSYRNAQAQRLRDLGQLLPDVRTAVSENVQESSLAGIGLKFPGIPSIIGPFGYFDARLTGSQRLIDLHAIAQARSSSESARAAQLSYRDARDLVVLAIG